MTAIPPGGVIGILGGGQLGRMLALAAAPLGYRCQIFAPEADAPAMQVAAGATVANYDDCDAVARFARTADVVTYEFENIPLATVETAAAHAPVRPGPDSLRVAQDRLEEKRFAAASGIATAPFAPVESERSLRAALAEIGVPAVLKTRRLGYDGKGQALIERPAAAGEAWAALARVPAILEGFVAFARELSVVAARGLDGTIACYDAVENRHRDHILHTTVAPAPIPPARAAQAQAIARTVLERLGHVGVLAVELFDLDDGPLLVNEIAPRVHNSGHWSIEGAATSQFAQHVRAICGLPLGSAERLFDAEMTNLLGAEIEAWPALLAEPGAHLHLYGKAEVRTGRKMGHVTRLRPRRG